MLSVSHHHAPFQEELELLFNTLAGHPHYLGLGKTGLVMQSKVWSSGTQWNLPKIPTGQLLHVP